MGPKEKKEEIDIDEIRDHAENLISKKISKEKAISIEEGIFDSLERFNIMEYSILLVKVIESLKIPYVQEQLKKNIWKPEDLATMDKDILFPEKWQHLQELRMPKNIKERRKGTNKCPRCKSWYTTYSQAQTRSADEGLTTRVQCEDCSFVFKF